MRRTILALTAAALAACGGGGGSSSEQGDPPPASGDLWPLGAGASWTYRVNDPLRGVFDKVVRVEGASTVPGAATAASAILVRDTEPLLEELSWQVREGGLVFRAREEDRRDGAVVRSTTWTPAELKSVASVPAAGWVHDATVHQTITHADGTVTEKDERFVWRVVAASERVTVPAGTFDCVRIARVNPDKAGSERTYWLAAGVGKVREEGERVEELVSYRPPPGG